MKIILLFNLLLTVLLANQTQNENIINIYFKEIIGFILILTIFIIFVLLKKNKDDKKQVIDVFNEKEVAIDESITIEKTDGINKHKSTAPAIKRKKIQQYTKKRKDDFKDFKNSRIMLAEDNMINQKVVSGLLSTSGIQIVMVDDGLEAIKFLEKDNDFCIILMDANMPNMDGYEATRLIRQNENYNHITVIALSGDVGPDDVKKMKDAGMQEHLEKPLKINALYSVLAAYSFKRKNIVDLNESINITDKQELYTELGIEVCGGDEDFYKEILNDFINDYSDVTSKIQNFLNNGKFSEVDKLLLDISGVVANIGATNIKNLVKEFKLSIKTPEDEKYILIFKKYAKHFEALKNEVKDYLKSSNCLEICKNSVK